MHRLFVGIDPPFDVKDALMEAMGGIIGARWQSEDQLHLTLRFLGERTFREAGDIAEALADVRTRSATIGISGVGLFDRRGRPSQLWARVTPPEDTARLHKKVDRALLQIGIPGETRAFLPHITLARFSRGSGPLDDFMVRYGDLQIPAYTADEFCLYESKLTSAGAEYTIVERYTFAQETLFGPSFL